jgi:hypothetical protein
MLGEPDLQRVSEERETFRMLWLRSFHEPVAVRLVRDGNRYIVITAQAVRRPDGSFGPTRRDSLSLDPAAWKRVVELAEIRQFWSLRAPDTLGLDGARWIIEGRRGQRYHAVDWWSPDDRDGPHRPAAFRGLALDILDQGTVCVKPSAVY